MAYFLVLTCYILFPEFPLPSNIDWVIYTDGSISLKSTVLMVDFFYELVPWFVDSHLLVSSQYICLYPCPNFPFYKDPNQIKLGLFY